MDSEATECLSSHSNLRYQTIYRESELWVTRFLVYLFLCETVFELPTPITHLPKSCLGLEVLLPGEPQFSSIKLILELSVKLSIALYSWCR